MDDITFKLPRHAVRLLARMCRMQRKVLVKNLMDAGAPSLQSEAAFDSLNEIESAIPQDIYEQIKEG